MITDHKRVRSWSRRWEPREKTTASIHQSCEVILWDDGKLSCTCHDYVANFRNCNHLEEFLEKDGGCKICWCRPGQHFPGCQADPLAKIRKFRRTV